jgi:hypothetical protein
VDSQLIRLSQFSEFFQGDSQLSEDFMEKRRTEFRVRHVLVSSQLDHPDDSIFHDYRFASSKRIQVAARRVGGHAL